MSDNTIETFLHRWSKAGGTERANYQLFLTELCSLLQLPLPEPAGNDTKDNAYVFERRVVIAQPDGSRNNGFIDLYKRGCFVLEAKQTGKTLDSSGWDKAMLRAHNQADQYARALPVDEGRPPFIIVVDVGRNIELYSEFSRSGATYTPFPDPANHRIRLEDLRDDNIRQRLAAVWLDPLSLDPSRRSARVTRDIANQLALLAKSLETEGHAPQEVADFLMRALFTMFSEDVGLLPERSFTELLYRLRTKPEKFAPMVENLWQTMNTGGFSAILEDTLLRFNGGLFAHPHAIALNREQLELLILASEANWSDVEPAIFGTLLERALNPRERHKLGAHYTPRAYVERLVLPTIIEPLRNEWREVQAAALTYEQQGKHKEAVAEVRAFHRHLCEIKVLDPACGSGNFLYVTLDHMKRLEGEVLNLLHDLGETQGLLDLQGITVDPHQFLGLEINPRASRIAEMVLWIGYLQWHFRTHGHVNPPEPVLRDFHNIENRDALIDYEAMELVVDADGKPVTRWDGVSYKISPITGEKIPDESCQVEQYRYLAPRKAVWPQADYIVGNPPFIGASTMRRALGDGYVNAVRGTWTEVPESADFVMYWWHIAAESVRAGHVQQFGFITTNSIRQTFNRRVIQAQLEAKSPLSLVFAIPDHPWVDSADGAQVRIAMTVGAKGNQEEGLLLQVAAEANSTYDSVEVHLNSRKGQLFADLTAGANLTQTQRLQSNSGIGFRGVTLMGSGFWVEPDDELLLKEPNAVKQLRNGKDLTNSPRGVYAIDFFGLTESEACTQFPSAFQRVLTGVKPEREQSKRETYRLKWWIFAEARPDLRKAKNTLSRYIATAMTAKHRTFLFLDEKILPDQGLIAITIEDALCLGVLSSRIHVGWSLAAGGTLEDRPRYNNSTCFETFPFPDATPDQQTHIRALAEQLDVHRKRQQAEHSGLTLTGMYNVLEKLRSGEKLNDKEKLIHQQGLVSILRELHDQLDRAVFAAYGWDDLADKLVGLPGATTPLSDKPETQAEAEEELLSRLVALNAERAAEEARGYIRWLRPEYQNPTATKPVQQTEIDIEIEETEKTPTDKITKQPWPKSMREQVAAVRSILQAQTLSIEDLANRFKRSPKNAVQSVIDALEELGMVQQNEGLFRLVA